MELTYKINWNPIEISFNQKPSADIIYALKAHNFIWKSPVWIPNPRRHQNLDILESLGKLVDRANGYRRPDAPCWKCKDEKGYFRSMGAATPVYCDSCWDKLQTKSVI